MAVSEGEKSPAANWLIRSSDKTQFLPGLTAFRSSIAIVVNSSERADHYRQTLVPSFCIARIRRCGYDHAVNAAEGLTYLGLLFHCGTVV